ncbi:hypothetical protein CLOM_g6434 [Closterium sp. NIES-68]|nr:hypothetical protein CLOM_g6434 [Closterium sp. NIES-68]
MDTGAGGTISGPLAASGGPDASSTYGGLDPSDVELSPAVTTVAFSPAPLPPLRLPVKAGPGDSPERGKWVLAFQDEASWRGAWGACERKIGEQCEVGARMGCSVRATTRCQEALPWGLRGAGGGFLGVMELLGVGGGGGRGGEEEEKEREACEEREMMACLATAQDACREHAQQQCATAFSQALIARSLTSIPLPLLDRRAQRALLRAALHRRQTAAAAEGSGRGGSRGGGPGGGGGAAGAGGADVERSPGAKLAQQAAAAGLVAGGRGGGGVGGGGGGEEEGEGQSNVVSARGLPREGGAAGVAWRSGLSYLETPRAGKEEGMGERLGRRMVRVVVAGAAVPGTQQLVALSLAAAVGTRGTLNPGLLRGKHCLQWEAGK